MSERPDTNLIAKVCQGKGSFQEGAQVEAYCHEIEASIEESGDLLRQSADTIMALKDGLEEWGTKETEQRVRAAGLAADLDIAKERVKELEGLEPWWASKAEQELARAEAAEGLLRDVPEVIDELFKEIDYFSKEAGFIRPKNWTSHQRIRIEALRDKCSALTKEALECLNR